MKKDKRQPKFSISIYRARDSISLSDVKSHLELENYFELKTICVTGWNSFIYYKVKHNPIKWKEFLNTYIEATNTSKDPCTESDVIEPSNPSPIQMFSASFRGKTESAILAIQKINSPLVYLIAFGAGFFSIAELVDPDFGISILSRIIKKDEESLKQSKKTNLTGGIHGEIHFFRNKNSLEQNENFGSFYQEIKAIIDTQVLCNFLGFKESDLSSENLCIAKSSFKIQKTIDSSRLYSILDGFEKIECDLNPIEINSVRKLSPLTDKALIRSLRQCLLFQIYRRFIGKKSYQFDLCHRDYEKYLTASTYQIINKGQRISDINGDPITSLQNIEDLFDVVKANGQNKLRQLFEDFLACQIESLDENSVRLTLGKVSTHIISDISYGNARFFLVDDSWYSIQASYILKLNSSCELFINNATHKSALLPWDNGLACENDYNAKYLDQNNCIVCDMVLPEYIELFDFAMWNDDTIYLYHAKIGFGNTMRDLCSQVFIAATRLHRDLHSDNKFEFVTKLYQAIHAKKGGNAYFDKVGQQTDKYSLDYFKSLFGKRIVFVLAVKDDAKKKRSFGKMADFDSNIAKLSLYELYKKMNNLGMPMEVAQL